MLPSKRVEQLSSSPPHSGKNSPLTMKLLHCFQIQIQIKSTGIIPHLPTCSAFCHVVSCQKKYIAVSAIIIPRTARVTDCFLGELTTLVIMIQQTFTQYLLEPSTVVGLWEIQSSDGKTMAF